MNDIIVGPAYAGMILDAMTAAEKVKSRPRVCGDDPFALRIICSWHK